MPRSTPRSAGTTLARTADKAGELVAKAPAPARAMGLAAAGLAGGLALGAGIASRRKVFGILPGPRRKVLGVPIGRKPASLAAGRAFAEGAKRLAETSQKALRSADDVRAVREQLEQANRQSPIEVLLDGLTHRRGRHRNEN